MKTLTQILEVVKKAGRIGVQLQQQIKYHDREFKDDGSVVTEADREIEDFLCNKIREISAGCNLVTEERSREFRDGESLTFVIDPIDGTDNFSSRMHNWSISVGVLDKELRPVGGIVYAPRLDFLAFADLGKPALFGTDYITPPSRVSELTKLSGIVMSSKIHQQLDIRDYPGKARALGSAALHLCMPAIYPSVVGAIQDNKAFAWDVAGAHAVLCSLGCEISYFDYQSLNYSRMKDNNWRVEDFIVAGKPGVNAMLLKCLKKIS